mmetsp:Transcript_21541/g.64107  ORF Transcript_21541/g.64107 Transcript_21541/m.64107 type:complete len:1164 (+) Transcript_21541:247-3738(+)
MARVPCLFVGSISLAGFEDGADGGASKEQVSRDVELSVSMLRGVRAAAKNGDILFDRPVLDITEHKVCPTSRHICCFVTTEDAGQEVMHAFQFDSERRAEDVNEIMTVCRNAAEQRARSSAAVEAAANAVRATGPAARRSVREGQPAAAAAKGKSQKGANPKRDSGNLRRKGAHRESSMKKIAPRAAGRRKSTPHTTSVIGRHENDWKTPTVPNSAGRRPSSSRPKQSAASRRGSKDATPTRRRSSTASSTSARSSVDRGVQAGPTIGEGTMPSTAGPAAALASRQSSTASSAAASTETDDSHLTDGSGDGGEVARTALQVCLAILGDNQAEARTQALTLLSLDRLGDTAAFGIGLLEAIDAATKESPSRSYQRLAAELLAVVMKADAPPSLDSSGTSLSRDVSASTLSDESQRSLLLVSTHDAPPRLLSPGAQNYPRELNMLAQRRLSAVSFRGSMCSPPQPCVPCDDTTPTPGDGPDDGVGGAAQAAEPPVRVDSVKGVNVVVAGSPDQLLFKTFEALKAREGKVQLSLVDRARAIESAVMKPADLLAGVRRMTDANHILVDTFFLTFRMFYSPDQLADQLLALHAAGRTSDKAAVLQCVTHWVTFYWSDFSHDASLLEKMEELHEAALASIGGGSLRASGDNARMMHHVELCHVFAHVLRLQKQRPVSRPLRGGEAYGPTENVVAQLQPRSIAAQLTLLNHGLISKIHPVEYVLYYFPGEGQKAADVAPHLEAAIKRFDAESFWAAAEILFPTKAKERAAMITKFIKVAEHCLKLGNFFSLFAVLGALCFPEVARLRSAWERVPEKSKRVQAELELVMDPSRNMKVYRDRLATFDDDPRVPFLPLHLKDLVFANEAGSTWDGGRVNFEKLIMVARCVLPVTGGRRYNTLEIDHALQTYFRVSVVPSVKGPFETALSEAASNAAALNTSAQAPPKAAKGSTMAAMRQAIKDSFLRSRAAPSEASPAPRSKKWSLGGWKRTSASAASGSDGPAHGRGTGSARAAETPRHGRASLQRGAPVSPHSHTAEGPRPNPEPSGCEVSRSSSGSGGGPATGTIQPASLRKATSPAGRTALPREPQPPPPFPSSSPRMQPLPGPATLQLKMSHPPPPFPERSPRRELRGSLIEPNTKFRPLNSSTPTRPRKEEDMDEQLPANLGDISMA